QIDLPDLFDRMGPLRYSGDFRGRYNNFHTTGQLHTLLGELDTDVQIDFRDQPPQYAGAIHSDEFDLGQLLDLEQFGVAEFATQVSGQHFDPQLIDLQWEADIHRLDYHRYRYRQIQTSGTLHHRLL